MTTVNLKYSDDQIKDIISLCQETVDTYRQYRDGHGWGDEKAKTRAMNDTTLYLVDVRKSSDKGAANG